MYREDTKLIDFIAALAAGLMLQYPAWSGISFLKPQAFTAENAGLALLYMAACAVASLSVFLWKSEVRRRVGWAIIAVLGAGFCTGIHEYFTPDVPAHKRMVMFEGHEFVVLNFMFKCYTTLLVMGMLHYSGVLIRECGRKLRGRYP